MDIIHYFERQIIDGIKKALLRGNPKYILISTTDFISLKKIWKPLRQITFNGGAIIYNIRIALTSEIPPNDPEWDEAGNTYSLEFIVSPSVQGIEVLCDPGSEVSNAR